MVQKYKTNSFHLQLEIHGEEYLSLIHKKNTRQIFVTDKYKKNRGEAFFYDKKKMKHAFITYKYEKRKTKSWDKIFVSDA